MPLSYLQGTVPDQGRLTREEVILFDRPESYETVNDDCGNRSGFYGNFNRNAYTAEQERFSVASETTTTG